MSWSPKNFDLPEIELMTQGHLACPGCGATIGMRMAMKGLGARTMVVIPACCWAVINGPFPFSALEVPVIQTAFETAAITATGIKHALIAKGDTETTVLAWAGDGGTFDIGLQAISGAAERNEDIVYICYDNEAYMNTGIQRSSATPYGAWTTTTPVQTPKQAPKKNIVEILAAHGAPYLATASIAFPDDFIAKVKKAKETKGFSFVHLFSTCPAGHKSRENDTIKIARLAVETGVFPLYEVENGETYTINHTPKWVDVDEYLSLQGRFRHLTEEHKEAIRANIKRGWGKLESRAGLSGAS